MKVAVTIAGQLRDYKINALNHIKHLIEPNKADVFVYACSKNTMHTIGDNVTQNYKITNIQEKESLVKEVENVYGHWLKGVQVNENEDLDDSNFGTLGYFKKRMNNQMQNIKKGYEMAINYSDYDAIVRCRPDNSMFLRPIKISNIDLKEKQIYTTIYPSGHKDPWFFSFSKPETFSQYCSFVYQDGANEARTDNNFDCPELALEKYLISCNMQVVFVPSVCLPFYSYDKTAPVTDFPFRDDNQKLISQNGEWVSQVT